MALFGRKQTATSSPGPVARSVELPTGKGRRVAGLSFHTAAVRKITRASSSNNGGSWDLSATLIREPANPHDPNAIAVWVNGVEIGHVNAADAVGLAPIIDTLEQAGCRATCHCRIFGGTDDIFGADLWISVDSRLRGWVARQVAAWQSPEPFCPH